MAKKHYCHNKHSEKDSRSMNSMAFEMLPMPAGMHNLNGSTKKCKLISNYTNWEIQEANRGGWHNKKDTKIQFLMCWFCQILNFTLIKYTIFLKKISR